MIKRSLGVVLALVLAAGVLSALPARAATAVPAKANIEDPLNDANFLNDQGQPGACAQGQCVAPPDSDDTATPADGSAGADIMKVWFSHTAAEVTAHFLLENPPPKAGGIQYVVYASPGEGSVTANTLGCIRFIAMVRGEQSGQATTWQGPNQAKLLDACNDGSAWFSNGVEGEVAIETLDDGTGIVSITGPRSYSPFLADGESLTAPQAQTKFLFGESSLVFAAPAIWDTTKIGTDYEFSTGGPAPSEPPVIMEPETPKEEPAKEDPPKKKCKKNNGNNGKKKCKKKQQQESSSAPILVVTTAVESLFVAPATGQASTQGPVTKDGSKKKCKKGKKKCKKPKPPTPVGTPPPAACPAYTPGEDGVDALTTLVTEAATEEQPIEVKLDTPTSDPVGGAHTYHNIQVDSTTPETGLYVRWEFDLGQDYDLYLNNPDGSEAAHVGGFNPAPVEVFDGTGNGGHSEQDAEALDGIRSHDCQGYTIDIDSYLTEGGEYTLKLWLGEATYPAVP